MSLNATITLLLQLGLIPCRVVSLEPLLLSTPSTKGPLVTPWRTYRTSCCCIGSTCCCPSSTEPAAAAWRLELLLLLLLLWQASHQPRCCSPQCLLLSPMFVITSRLQCIHTKASQSTFQVSATRLAVVHRKPQAAQRSCHSATPVTPHHPCIHVTQRTLLLSIPVHQGCACMQGLTMPSIPLLPRIM